MSMIGRIVSRLRASTDAATHAQQRDGRAGVGETRTPTDVCQTEESGEALSSSEAGLRMLLGAMTDLIMVLDGEGRYLDIPSTSFSLSRELPADLLGKTLHEVLPGGQAEEHLQYVRRALAMREVVEFEYSQEISGREVWFAGTVSPLREDSVVWVARDITERRKTEQALRESEAKYRTLVEQLPVLIYIEAVDQGETRWDFLYVSPQHEDLLGYSTEEWTADNHLWERLLHPEDRERVMAEDERTDRTGEPFRIEYRFVARDGTIVWVHDDAVLVRDEEGSPLFWQGVIYDITERRRAEEEIRHLNEDLEGRVAERTAQLEAYAERLAASNRELQDFAHVASHDLQEPLRKVLAFGERLKTKYGDVLDERGLDYLSRMEAATLRMQGLIEDLLSLSRVTTRAHPFEPVDLGEAAREVLADLEARVEETGGRVEVGELPTVEADRAQVRQLLQNLIGNALKFHKKAEPPVVKVYGRLEDRGGVRDVCRLVVEDNGIGFDEQYLGRIFAPFERLHGRATYEGTGMGLAICRKVVERHGGEITAKSVPGEGSTFVVTLPAKQ